MTSEVSVRSPTRTGTHEGVRRRKPRNDAIGYAFVAPFAIPFLLFSIGAVLFGIGVSFTDWAIVGDVHWVGLENFRQAVTEPGARQAYWNSLLYVVIIVPVVTILGLAAALFVNRKWPGHTFARMAFYSSNVVSAPVIGLVWVWMLDTQFGLFNQYLGISVPWLTSPRVSLFGVSLASVWWDMGIAFILFLAGLQEVDGELKNAARVDGANAAQVFWNVMLPGLRNTVSLVIILQIVSTSRIFSQIHVMTNGGPAGSSTSVVHYIYTEGLTKFRLGYASALSVLLFAAVALFSIVFLRLFPQEAA